MKKILGTTLVAFALIAVSTVDAKVMKRRMEGTRPMSKELNTVSQELVVNPSQENVDKVKDALMSTTTGNQQDIVQLQAKKTILEDKKTAKEQVIAAMPKGSMLWFLDKRTDEQKTARQVAEQELKAINDDIKNINQEIAKVAVTKEEKTYVQRVKEAIASLRAVDAAAIGLTVGGIAYFIDQLAFGGAGTQYTMQKGAAAYKFGKEKGAAAYETGKGLARGAYAKGEGMVRGAYARVRGTEPAVTE
jgi:hypothetical protein